MQAKCEVVKQRNKTIHDRHRGTKKPVNAKLGILVFKMRYFKAKVENELPLVVDLYFEIPPSTKFYHWLKLAFK